MTTNDQVLSLDLVLPKWFLCCYLQYSTQIEFDQLFSSNGTSLRQFTLLKPNCARKVLFFLQKMTHKCQGKRTQKEVLRLLLKTAAAASAAAYLSEQFQGLLLPCQRDKIGHFLFLQWKNALPLCAWTQFPDGDSSAACSSECCPSSEQSIFSPNQPALLHFTLILANSKKYSNKRAGKKGISYPKWRHFGLSHSMKLI